MDISPLFMYSPFDTHQFVRFWLLQIKVLLTLVYKSLSEHVCSFLLTKYQGVEQRDHNFLRNCQTGFQSTCTIFMPTNRHESSSFSTPSTILDMVIFLNSGQSSRCVMVSYCLFNFNFSID